jgi:hypothetical protein
MQDEVSVEVVGEDPSEPVHGNPSIKIEEIEENNGA